MKERDTMLRVKVNDIFMSKKKDDYLLVEAENSTLLRLEPFVFQKEVKNDVGIISSILSNKEIPEILIGKRVDGLYSVIKGQNVIINIINYINGDYSHNYSFYHNLSKSNKDKILFHELRLFILDTENRNDIENFKRENRLSEQQYLNRLYTGKWERDTIRYFGSISSPAYQVGKKLVGGSPVDLRYLAKAIDLDKGDLTREEYVILNYKKESAEKLWNVFLEKATS